jgi:peptide-methionine (S)-S-oxide reductase
MGKIMDEYSQSKEIATLGGGCFWCLDAVFQNIRGVTKVESGYSGGQVHQPSYEQICQGNTGHAEVVRVHFQPEEISYEEILEIFFTIHDPTTLNRQGNDVGTQYRSVIYFHHQEQKEIAEKTIKKMSAIWDDPIVTELKEAPMFYMGEAYHQNYYAQNPHQGYCSFVVAGKVAKARKAFAHRFVN